MHGLLLTGSTGRLLGEAGKRCGLLRALSSARRRGGDRLATGGRMGWPEPIEREEQPHQSDEHELVENQVGIMASPFTR